ncbi:MAG TPA: methyltransferase domain-containing protein [Deinococcales bacterium]|nr:methyltransferase domain-containing protein [Deinococcales bacterium]
MTLLDVVGRDPRPAPWAEGDNIPWNDPEFSERMLAEHLSQDHDKASRRLETVDRHVAWIHRECLGERPGRVLDLACGPGLYALRLARLGHEVLGIDFAPASIRHARQEAEREGLSGRARFVQADLRAGNFGEGFDLALLLYGQVNVFRPDEVRALLAAALAALRPGGTLLLEPQTAASLRAWGESGPGWWSAPTGLFSPEPHLALTEHFWDEASATMTERFYILDAETGAVTRHAMSAQAHPGDALERMLLELGAERVERYPSLANLEPEGHPFYALAGWKAG